MSDKAAVVEKNALLRLQKFWFHYKTQISAVVIALIVIFGGWYGYVQLILNPREQKASEMIYQAQEYFAMDSCRLALNGDGTSKGFNYIINNFGGTKTANLAHFYAGVCYLKLGQFDNAIKYLSDFSTGSKQIQMIAYGTLADAYSEKNEMDKAVNYYQKAAQTFPSDENNSAEYLFRAGLLSETLGKNEDALKFYKKIKSDFPKSDKATQIDKYIYRLSIEANDFSTK